MYSEKVELLVKLNLCEVTGSIFLIFYYSSNLYTEVMFDIEFLFYLVVKKILNCVTHVHNIVTDVHV